MPPAATRSARSAVTRWDSRCSASYVSTFRSNGVRSPGGLSSSARMPPAATSALRCAATIGSLCATVGAAVHDASWSGSFAAAAFPAE